MISLLRLLFYFWLEVIDPGLIHSHKSLGEQNWDPPKTLDMLSRVRFKSGPSSCGAQCVETVDI